MVAIHEPFPTFDLRYGRSIPVSLVGVQIGLVHYSAAF